MSHGNSQQHTAQASIHIYMYGLVLFVCRCFAVVRKLCGAFGAAHCTRPTLSAASLRLSFISIFFLACFAFSNTTHAATLTLSGTLYSDEGVTSLSGVNTIAVAVGTTTTSIHATTTNASGAWTLTIPDGHTITPSTPILIYVDASTTVRAALFTKASSSVNSISNLDLYQNRVIISHEGTSGTSTTNDDLAFYDATNDTDIQYDAASSTNTLIVNAGNELYIKTGKTFAPGGDVTVRGNASTTSATDGNLRIPGTAVYTNGGVTTLAGSLLASSTASYNHNDRMLVMNASTTGKSISYATTSTLGNITFAGTGSGGEWTMATNSTTTHLYIATSSTLTAPTLLTVQGDFVNMGSLIHSSGTIRMASTTAHTITTRDATSTAFGDLTIDNFGAVTHNTTLFTTATDTVASYIYSFAIDTTNGVLYAGSGNDGVIYRCDTTTGCDSAGDFTVAYNTTETYILSLTFDVANGVLYAGTQSSGIIYRCATSTGCDASGDFTTAIDTAATYIYSLTVDTTNGVLYAGSGGSGIIYRCATSTGCDASGDFTTAIDTAATGIYSLIVDYANGTLYAGSFHSTSGGIIYRCATSTGCDASGDFTTATDTPATEIESLAIDTTNGVLYAGSGSYDTVFRCLLSTGCDSAGDFTAVWNVGNEVWSLTLDPLNGFLYVGIYPAGYIFRCATSTGCDSAGEFISTGYTSAASSIGTLTIDPVNGVLYAGTDLGSIVRCVTVTRCNATTPSASTVATSLTINTNSSYTANTITELRGNYINNGTSTFGTAASLFLTSGSAQTLSGTFVATGSLPSVTFSGGGTKTFSNNASTSNFTIETGATVVAPSSLTINGSYTNYGTFTAGNGLVTLKGRGSIATGTMTDSSAFSVVNIEHTGTQLFTTATDTAASYIYSLTIDTTNGVLYAGSSGSGIIYRCATSTGCDSAGDFTTATDTAASYIYSLTIDTTNGVLYAGDDYGTIYRCDTTTGCDSAGDFIIAATTAAWDINSLSVDSVNGVLYAGAYPSGVIYRCETSTGCDSAGDFTTATDTAASYIYSLTIDTTNGVLYAGSSGSGIIYRCATSTGCDSAGDFTIATDTAATYIYSLTIDTTNGVLYAGSGGSGIIYRCATSTGCDSAGDFAIATATEGSYIYSLAIDTTNGVLYAGSGYSEAIFRCSLSTGCDSIDDFVTATTTAASEINSLAIDTTNGVLYAGSSYGGVIYRSSFNTTFGANASTTNLTIQAGASLLAPRELTIGGSYTNSGTFRANGGTTTFTGVGYTATGTLTGTSSFNNLVLEGSGALNLPVAIDTADFYIYSLVVDTTNGVLYAGSAFSGIIYRCILSTGCDSAGDFTTATDTAESYIWSLTIDTTNGVLYAGSGSDGIIYRCATSTGCDSVGDFTTATNTAESFIYSLTIDTTNGVLYAGSSAGGVIYRCATSTGCDSVGDFTTAVYTGASYIYSLTIDTTNGVLYAGAGDNGIIYRCATSTGCDSAGDFTTATDTASLGIRSLTIDTQNGVLYAGDDTSGIIYRCATSTGCDSAGDFTTATVTASSDIRSLTIDQTNGVLYAGGAGGIIYRCILSTGCDSAGDFTTATDTAEAYIYSLTIDQTNGVLYAGSSISGIIYRAPLATTLAGNASTTNLRINTGGLIASSSLSIFGNLSNSGRFINNGTTTNTLYIASTTANQTLSGNLVGYNDLGNVTLLGTSTKTFGSNASTTNLTINTGATLVAPTQLSISGSYTNSGTTTHTGTTTFNGTTAQTATGTMSGTSAFYNLVVTNNTATTTFGNTLTVANQFSAITPSTTLAFASGATSTFATLTITGTTSALIKIRSTTDSSAHNFVVTGGYTVSYADIKDSNACGSTGGTLTASNSTDSTGNTCWSFTAAAVAGLLLSGYLYSDEGITAVTSGKAISIAIGTTTVSLHATTSSATGAWSFTLGTTTIATSTPIAVWVDNDATTRAALFTKASSSIYNIPNLDLYQNRVIISHEGTSGTSTVNDDLAFYDATNDTDIQYDAASSTNTLTVNAGNELYIKTGKTFAPGGDVTVRGNASASTTDGTLRLPGTAVYTAGGVTTLAGSLLASSTASYNHNDRMLVMNASTTGKSISYATTTTLGNITLAGTGNGGEWTFGTATAATTTHLYIATSSTLTAPTLLTVQGDFINMGNLVHGSNTIRMASTSNHTITTRDATTTAFGDLTIDNTGLVSHNTSLFTIATDTRAYQIYSFVIDTTNGVLYAGSDNIGHIYRCVLSTGCDSAGDFTTATDTAATDIRSLTVDTTNGVLYAGSDASGRIYRCATSTGCDSAGDFTTATDTAESIINSLTIDTANGVLYAGSWNSGIIYRCATSTGCDSAGDFTTATDTAESYVYSLTVDEVNGVLYAGSNPSGIIYRCATSTGCDSAGDFTIATDTAEFTIYSLTIDTTNGVLYAGADSGIIYRCATSTGCDSAGDFTAVSVTDGGSIYSFTIDTTNNVLYIGTSWDTFRCSLATGCDDTEDFSITSYSEADILALIFDGVNGVLYSGYDQGFDEGIIYRCVVATGCDDTLISATTTLTNMSINTSSTYSANTITELRGNYTNNGTAVFSTTTTLRLTGGSAQTLSGTLVEASDLSAITFSGAGTKTFSNNASTSSFTIETGATVVAPSSLTIGREYINNGTFTAGASTTFTGIGYTATGTMTGTSAFNTLSVDGSGSLNMSTATDTTSSYIYALTVDSQNGVLYTGSWARGIIYRCTTSTGCDSAGDFTTATDTAATTIYSLAVDTTNGVLYAGSDNSGIIYRCTTSTGCDSAGDFTTATDTAANAIYSLTIDTTNGVLYAGSGNSGIIYRCATSTGCDSSGDFTTATDTVTSNIRSLTVDTTNGVLYAGDGFYGIIYRCATSTGCDSAGDFTTATDTASSYIYSLTIDTTNGVLYAGSGTNGIIYRCATSTGCDSSGDFTTATDTAASGIYSLTIDTANGVLYAGSDNSGIIYRCTTSTGCDSLSDFVIAVDYFDDTTINSLTIDSTNGVLYAGSADDGIIYRSVSFSTTFGANASTSNLTIQAGATVVAPRELTIGGNYTNSGTFRANGGTTTFTGVGYTATGTLNASSSFNNLVLEGNGTLNLSIAGTISADYIYSFTTDTANGVLYAGANYGIIFRCALSTGCDSSGDFTTATDTVASTIDSLTIDTTNGILYAGSSNSGIIYRCATSTGCDSALDFTTATDTAASSINSLIIDTTNGALYAGSGSNGIIFRCATSTGCDSAGDFTTATDTAETSIHSLTIDTTNGILYAGSGIGGIIFRCALSTGCDSSGDYTTAIDTTETSIDSLTIDTTNGVLYAGATNGIIYRCALSTGCDAPGDYTTATDTVANEISSLSIDTINGVIYAVSPNSGLFYRCITSTGCDSDSDFEIVADDTTGIFIHSLTIDTTNGVLYAGSGLGDSLIYRTPLATTLSGNASTTNLRIGTGGLIASSSLTVSGNLTNNGRFVNNSGTLTLSSTTNQYLSGNLVGYNDLGTTTLIGTSTKYFTNNASTTHLTIGTGTTMSAPSSLTISGNYTNSGTTTYSAQSTTTLHGATTQTMSGTMTGRSAFANLTIANTSGLGTSTQSVIFTGGASTTDTFTMNASTSVQFLGNSTSTFQNISFGGEANRYVYLRSSASSTSWGLAVPGTQKLVTYTNVQDSDACTGNADIGATDGTSIDAGGNTCWNFGSAITLESDDNQTFAYNQATTTISPLTITEGATPIITAVNDIRIKIATSTVRMRFDTTDTTATLGGTASGKVSGTVSYEGEGSVLVLDVTSDFAANDTLTISDLAYTQFTAVNAATPALAVYTDGTNDVSANDTDSRYVSILGSLAFTAHTDGQASNAFTALTVTDAPLYTFKITPAGENATITALVLGLDGIQGMNSTDLTNVRLYRDMNSDGIYDGGDIQVGGTGSVSFVGLLGTISFGTPFIATTTRDYIVIGDLSTLYAGDALSLYLDTDNTTAIGTSTLESLILASTLSTYRHVRDGQSYGGGAGEVGGPPPAGDGIRTGGDETGGGDAIDPDTGSTIGSEVGYTAPSSHGTPQSAWITGGNTYVSDGSYATTSTDGAQHSYGTFGFSVPGTNQITGIGIKLESSASTEAGTISVRLSWDGGSSVTSLKTTDTLTTTDDVYELGGQGDTWGRTWSPSEFNNGSFTIEVVANTSSNYVRIDAIQVKVFHQATGASGGGGGSGEVSIPSNRFFANVWSAVEGSVMSWWKGLWDGE